MHLTIDGSVLSALFVLAFAIWACGSYVVDLFKGSRTVVSVISLFTIAVATVATVLALIH